MRKQLRPFYTPEEAKGVYAERYCHSNWPDHILRVTRSAELLRMFNPTSVADLSCGDGSIVSLAALSCPVQLGDITPGWPICGPIEETIEQIDPVDVFVLSETLEHVTDPDALLAKISTKANRILLSTPDSEWHNHNPEHYWGWDTAEILFMLNAAGFNRTDFELFEPFQGAYYTFQIWVGSNDNRIGDRISGVSG